jgi:phosphopantothenoylcysteine decarboxylase/phosphopantothenate--cysteine ligase
VPDTGKGRLPEPEEIYAMAELLLHRPDALPRDLAGRTVVVTAGGDREPLDPVRFLGNRSSGRQGFALAAVAAARGARVRLVAANVDLPVPANVDVDRVGSAEQLQAATTKAATDADVVVMVAAVADFRPAQRAEHKIKKGAGEPDSIPLTRNPDILAAWWPTGPVRAPCSWGSPPRPATPQATRWPMAGASWPTRAAT